MHKLPKYLVWIGAFLFVAMFPVGELCAQNNLETLTNKDLVAYPPKSSLRATRWLCKADKFKAEGNAEKAVLYYTKAAEKGDACAQFVLSLCYNEGYGVSPDAERSMHWLSLSVGQEYALAQNFLGVMYTYHKENADYKKALAYYKKAALQGYSEAQYNVGWCYFNGYGVEADQEEAMRWIRKAADQEYALALDAMWQGYYFGTKGLPRDYKQAADWMEKAIAKGEQMPQFYLATLYLEGKGVEADTVKALSLFTQSAEEGYMWSQNKLGGLYEVGIGVPADSAAAYAWYKKAAEQGLDGAQNNMGRCYLIGIGVEKNPKLAVEWYQRSSQNGNMYAMTNLAWCYMQGCGIYGKDENGIWNRFCDAQPEKGEKGRDVLKRWYWFPPYEYMVLYYPWLSRNPVAGKFLLPAAWGIRAVRGVVCGRGKYKREMLRQIDASQIGVRQDIYRRLQLRFH